MSSTRLVEQVVSGKSAQHIIDALVEELPPLPMLYQIVRKEMPRGTGVRIEENVVFVESSRADRSKIREHTDYLQLMFPELEFVVENLTEKQISEVAEPKAVAALRRAGWNGQYSGGPPDYAWVDKPKDFHQHNNTVLGYAAVATRYLNKDKVPVPSGEDKWNSALVIKHSY